MCSALWYCCNKVSHWNVGQGSLLVVGMGFMAPSTWLRFGGFQYKSSSVLFHLFVFVDETRSPYLVLAGLKLAT